MRKTEFIIALTEQLAFLSKEERKERLDFYVEMIDDAMEEGASEEEAVARIGSIEQIAEQILTEVPFVKIAKEKIKKKRRLKTWEIVLLSVGSPLWLSLAIAAFAVLFSLYVVLWSLIVSVWAVFVSLAAAALGSLAGGIVLLCQGSSQLYAGLILISAALVCAGLAILCFLGCRAATKGILRLSKTIALFIKKQFVKKENAS